MKLLLRLLPGWLLLACLALPQTGVGQLKVVKFEEVAALQQAEARPMLVFIHTDWCRYCQGMKHASFKNEKVIRLLNEKFYFIDLNAEEKRSIRFRQQTFRYKPKGNNTGVHELAEQLGRHNGRLEYPALCFLNADYEILYQHQGFIDAKTLIKVLEQLQGQVH